MPPRNQNWNPCNCGGIAHRVLFVKKGTSLFVCPQCRGGFAEMNSNAAREANTAAMIADAAVKRARRDAKAKA